MEAKNMNQVPVKWITKETRLYPAVVDRENHIPVVPLSALREALALIVGQAHGGAMLGGDDAYKACLAIEVKAHLLLASLGEQ